MLFNSYSERTRCPECNAKIRLEKVNFMPSFSCPVCENEVRVSPSYQKMMRIASYSLGLLIAYALGQDKLWRVLLFWALCNSILMFPWAYVGKYWFPPKLEKCTPDPAHFQGLGLGPK